MRLLFLVLSGAFVFAAQPSPEAIKSAAENYLEKKAVTGFPSDFSLDEGYKAQSEFVKTVSQKLGPGIGYKVGLITKAGQDRFGATAPVRGVLLRDMLKPNGAEISSRFGINPSVELDMGVYVKNVAINDAKNLDEVVTNLSSLACFIELVDSIAATNQTMNAATLVALNVGARAGVIGQTRPMTAELAKALPNMKLILSDDSGKTLAEVPKLDLQPLDNILGLIASLKKENKGLKRGDFISLGSPATPQPVPTNQTLRLRYENIPGGPLEASVVFTD